jgi:putative FmdB family regulatory protein
MPTYEYVCEKCGHEFELFQSMSASPLKICPKDACARKKWGRGPVKKKISGGAGLIFKGSGFYITDNRSENYKKGEKSAVGESRPAAAKSETKSETKSASASSGSSPAPASSSAPASKAGKK